MLRQLHLRAVIVVVGIGVLACGGSGAASGSLQGTLSFTPNAVLAYLSAGTTIAFADSVPALACQFSDGRFPKTGDVQALLTIEIQTYGYLVSEGEFDITSSASGGAPSDGGYLVLLNLSGSTNPVSSQLQALAAGVSGTITLTKVGSAYAGNFSATVVQQDGGQSMLAGTFDTTTICPTP